MERLRSGARRVWKFITFGRSTTTYRPNDRQFKGRIERYDCELKVLKDQNNHTFSYRLFALRKFLDACKDFHEVTNDYCEHFVLSSILKAWAKYYKKVIRVTILVLDDANIVDDYSYIEDATAAYGTILMKLLDLRYEMISITRTFLNWTHFFREPKYDVDIFWEVAAVITIFDRIIVEESVRVMKNLDAVGDRLALDLVRYTNDYIEEVAPDVRYLLNLLRSNLFLRYPEHNIVTPPKRPIRFDTFPEIRIHKL